MSTLVHAPHPNYNKTLGTLNSDATKAVVPPDFQGHKQISKPAMIAAELSHWALQLAALSARV